MANYQAITDLLKADPKLSAELYFFDMDCGVKYVRNAAIFEPDPEEGQVDYVGGDQEFVHGPKRVRRNFDFQARDADESLDLLESACRGKPAQNTAKRGWGTEKAEHGYEEAKVGLDCWIAAGLRASVQTEKDSLIFRLVTSNFAVKDVLIEERKVTSVEEAFRPYQQSTVDASLPKHLQRGAYFIGQVAYQSRYRPENNLAERNVDTFTEKFLAEYQQALKDLKPFNITPQAQDALFLSLALGRMFKEEPRKDPFRL